MTDVHKYLRGELSAGEMHALEKASLDDPFLADALEGLATRADIPSPPTVAQPLATSPLDQDLSELRARLDARVAEKKSRLTLLPWMKVAAAVILLVGLGLSTWITTTKQKLDGTKTAPPPQPAADVASAPPARPPAAERSVPATIASASDEPKLSKAATGAHKHAPPTLSRARETEIKSLADSLDYAETLAASAAKNQASIPTFSLKKDTVAYNADFLAKNNHLATRPLLFSGQVRDANNRPLAGASLTLEGKSNGTVTDGEGYFKLYVPPYDTIRKLRVKYLGYDQASFALNSENRSGNVITLREHASALNEVVVTGLGMKRRETMAAPPSDDAEHLDSLWIRASPTIGRSAYLDYLTAAKKDLGADTATHGTVSISFNVDQKGQLSDFKIEQSLSPIHDAGIIRLISEGPSWKLLRGKKARLLVSVSFP
jgi:outer membrane biosynthesis protein TonB